MPNYRVQEISTLQDDFGRGIVGKISPIGLKKGAPPPFVKAATNVLFRPRRAMAVRPGYRDASQVVLSEPPVGMGKFYHDGDNRLFVATDSGGGAGAMWRFTTASRTAQTLPWAPTARRWSFAMANGILVACQQGAAQKPIFYAHGYGDTNTWYAMALAAPATAPTFSADSAGGSLTTAKAYYWRVRWNYANGSSKAGPASASHTPTSPNLTANLTIPLPASPRPDYVGWTLERTKQNGASSGPWYRVADGTASTASDGASDASLFYEADETLHGEPPVMEGTIYHRGRLFGWAGSLLYMSQPVIGDEATGICNWVGDAVFQVGKDDGDAIQSVVIQGERLLIGKRHSLWTLDGDDENSFRLVIRYEGAGFAGPTAAASVGPTVFFAGTDGKFFVMRGNSVEPIASEQVGEYVDGMDTGRGDEIIALNYLGEFVLFWYVPNNHAYADEVLAYDLRFGNWSHHDNMPATAALVQKDATDFGGAALLFADPTLLPPGNAGTAALNPSFIAWADRRSLTNTQTYLQSLSSLGAARLTANGAQVSNSTGSVTSDASAWATMIVPDSSTGCIVFFTDRRSGTTLDVYAQRYNAAGAAQWTAGGLLVATGRSVGDNEVLMAACADTAGGAVCIFQTGTGTFKAQRINSAGSTQWATPPTLYTLESGWTNAKAWQLVANSDGTFYVSWDGIYDGSGNCKRFAQRINADGTLAWSASGGAFNNVGKFVGTSRVLGRMSSPRPAHALLADGSGGAFIVDAITVGGSYPYSTRLYRIDSSGNAVIGADGVAVGGTSTIVMPPRPTLCTDGSTGCFVAWVEGDAGSQSVKVGAFTSAGAAKWAAITVGTAAPSDGVVQLTLTPDGFGGATVSWNMGNQAAGHPMGLHAAKVLGTGTLAWGDTLVSATADAYLYSFDHGTRQVAISDGAGGVILVWPENRTQSAAARDIYAQRIKADGAVAWTAGGIAVCALSNEQSQPHAMFTGTNEADYPGSATTGYHIWCGLTGTRDRAYADGSGGDLIKFRVDGHLYDDGCPNNTKDYEWFELYVNRGYGTIVATIRPDQGPVATLSLTAETRAPKYDTGIKYNSGQKYATIGNTKVGTGLPKGTEGRACAVSLAGQLESIEIGGWMLQAFILPRKDY